MKAIPRRWRRRSGLWGSPSKNREGLTIAEMKVLLVDSDERLRGKLTVMLHAFQCFRIAGIAQTTEEAVEYIQPNDVDVIFVNHQPADPRVTSGGEHLAAVLGQSHPHIQVVIYSNTAEWAYNAYRCQCAGYLLVPFDPLALQSLVNRLRYVFDLQQAKREVSNRSIMIKTRSGYQLTRLSNILFIERSNRKNRIVTTDGQEITLLGYTMNQLEDMLDGCGFYRCYQSFIVNLSQVAAVRADNDAKIYTIRFKDYEGEILLSREKYAELVALLKGRYARINI